MTKDNEDSMYEKTESVSLLYAIRRKKENRDKKSLCFRQVMREYDTDLKILEARIDGKKGVWRIYESLNKRNVSKARKELMKRLIDEEGNHDDRIDTLWKTCLAQPAQRNERNILLDLDTTNEDLFSRLKSILDKNDVAYIHHPTPNGHHFKCTLFDTRIVENFPELEIKRDALFFIRTISIS